VSRLESFVDQQLREPTTTSTLEDLFCSTGGGIAEDEYPDVASGGYLAFNIHPAKLCGFPPGYNEDWIWCKLQQELYGTRVAKMDEVIHSPRTFRKPSMHDCKFELKGDLVFDTLCDFKPIGARNLDETLIKVSAQTPFYDSLPSTRIKKLLAKTKDVHESHIQMLDEFGMRLLREMLCSKRLHDIETTHLATWARDACEKLNSFSCALASSKFKSKVFQLVCEENISGKATKV